MLQALTDERQHFVSAGFRLNEVWLFQIKIEKAVLKYGEFKVIVLFRNCLGRAAAVRAGIAGLCIIDVELARNAVLTGVAALVDVAISLAAQKQILHSPGVIFARG